MRWEAPKAGVTPQIVRFAAKMLKSVTKMLKVLAETAREAVTLVRTTEFQVDDAGFPAKLETLIAGRN